MLDDLFQDHRWNGNRMLTEDRLKELGLEAEWENSKKGDVRNG